MSQKNRLLLVNILIHCFIIAPIFYYLMYEVLAYVKATELMWFLFWAYVPISIMSSILIKIAMKDDD